METTPNSTPSSTDTIETYFLMQGKQRDIDVARRLATYLGQAQQTLDICAYSFNLCPDAGQIVLDALNERAREGVKIRIAYDAGTQQDLMTVHQDPCDRTTPQFVRSLGFPSKPIEGDRALMHHKYIILDGGTPQAQVWTGSTNFTDDSWQLQENNIIIFHSQELAQYYIQDFDEMWQDGDIISRGIMDSGEATLQYGGKPAFVSVNFSPGEGDWIDESIANVISRTEREATIAAVVITSTRIIHALEDLMKRGVPIDGIYDFSQMNGVKYQWHLVPPNRWKIPAFAKLTEYGHLVGKKSTPYTPTSIHDYMHNKVMVLDDVVLTGSYNFSRHAQKNAENSLIIYSEPLAETYREYVRRIADKYRNRSGVFTPYEEDAPKGQEAPEAMR